MFSRIIKAAASLSALMIFLSVGALAQTTSIEGTVKVKMEDGSLKPVEGAVIDIYRLDIKGQWEVKTDKQGRYFRIGMPLSGSYLIVASSPDIQPSWANNVRIAQMGVVDLVAAPANPPGSGIRPTLDQMKAALAQSKPGAAPAAPTAAADKSKEDVSKKEYEQKVKESQALQASFDTARNHYNQGIELMKVSNFQGALSELEQATVVDPGKHAAFAELAYKANANLAEAHYQVGVELFNQRKRDEAKPHFQQAIEAINKAISVAATSAEPNINNDLIVYYNILAKNQLLLVEHYGAAEMIDEAVKAFDKAETIDATNKNKWGVMKADMYRFAGRSDEAIEGYKAVLTADPNNIDAFYGLGLTLVASTEKAKLQEAANALAEFVAKAPPTDKRVPDAKASLEVLKNEFKVEAEKPARRRGKP